jgi:hypothetical protein
MIPSSLRSVFLFAAVFGAAEAKRPEPTFHFFPAHAGPGATSEQNYDLYPKTLSATGFYADMAARTVGPGIYAFDINSPLWSDGAGKSRYLVLPKDSVVVYANDTADYVFPEGTVFVKNFWIDTVENRPASRIFIETRMLVLQGGDWHGFSFKWRKDQTDADLVGGVNGDGHVDSFTVRKASGSLRKKMWMFPGRSGYSIRNTIVATCNSCHLNRATGRQMSILGFITPQLNLLANGRNQIEDMMEQGYMVRKNGAVYDAANAHRWYALDDSTAPGATLEKRARSYLASNCSHCHSAVPVAPISCFPIYTFNTPRETMNYMNRASRGTWGVVPPTDDSAKWIYPGKPEYSVILRRISAGDSAGYRDRNTKWAFPGNAPVIPTDPASPNPAPPRGLAKTAGWDGNGLIQMPPLATFEVNPLANGVIHAWIKSLPSGYDSTGVNVRGAEGSPHRGFAGSGFHGFLPVRNGLVHLSGVLSGATKARLTDLRGRSLELSSVSPGVFRMPAGASEGVFVLTVGGRRFALVF